MKDAKSQGKLVSTWKSVFFVKLQVQVRDYMWQCGTWVAGANTLVETISIR